MTSHPISDEMLAAKAATGHSVFGPSSASRWMRCPGSLIANLLAPDNPNKYAAEGTVAHWLAEDWLTNGNPYQHLGEIKTVEGFEIEITEEMISHVEEYVSWVSTCAGTHYAEVKVDFSSYTPIPNQGGTADHVSVAWQHLTITDLKYGMVPVSAQENKQALAYALGTFLKWDWLYDFQTITIRICQPRKDNYDEYVCTRDELLAFGEELREAAAAAWNPRAKRVPSPAACEYCRVADTCPARWADYLEAAQGAFSDDPEGYSIEEMEEIVAEAEIISEVAFAPLPELTIAGLVNLYKLRGGMEKFFREAFELLEHKAELGIEIPGHMLARGRAGRRDWIEAKKAKTFLLDKGVLMFDLFANVMASPAQAQKLLKIAVGGTDKELKAMLEPFVVQPPGRLTLVPRSDTREEVEPAASAFADDGL